MKRIAGSLVGLALFLPAMAWAQVSPEVYRIVTPAQVHLLASSTVVTLTGQTTHNVFDATCEMTCYAWFNVSGQTLAPTTATGIFLISSIRRFTAPINSTIRALWNGQKGYIHIEELGK